MIEKAHMNDYQELLRFENRVFKINFLKIMPKLYADAQFSTDCHGILRQNGKIIGAVAVYPCEYIVNDRSVKAVGIGSVAVAKANRGNGIMKELMTFADSRAAELNADIAVLSGYRLRYNRYGFEKCGIRHIFSISHYYLSHSKKQKSYTFMPLSSDSPLIAQCAKLYNREAVRWERPEKSFSDIIRTWNAKPFAVCDNKKAVGFIVSRKNTIIDIHLESTVDIADVLAAFAVSKHMRTLEVHIIPAQNELIGRLSEICENHSISYDACYKILNFKSFIEKMLNGALQTTKLPDGELKIKIEDEILQITVAGDKATVKHLTDVEGYDLAVDRLQATRVLTTYGAAEQYGNSILNAWSPLCPIGIAQTDEV